MTRLLILLLTVSVSMHASAQKGLPVGEQAPAFSGIDQHGDEVSLDALLDKGEVVLIFYRGAWCPHCQKHLSYLQDSLQMILDKGANVVYVSPERANSREKIIGKTGATFSVLSDADYSIMNAYDVTFKITKETVTKYHNFVLTKTRAANENEDDYLPVPATYIIDQDGSIIWRQFDKNYKNRSSVGDILGQLGT